MQKSAYYCDQCKRVLGDVAHVSLNINVNLSGVAVPPHSLFGEGEGPANWYVKSVPHAFMHFHITCVEKFFKKIAEINTKPKKK